MNRPEDGETDGGRDKFLGEMYKAMWDNINRHIGVIWHSVTVLVGAFAVLGLVDKAGLSIDFAVGLVVLVSFWQVAHVFDASYWVNRNLLIIANIERQFLRAQDLKEIHYYFGRHRKNKMIEHFQIQVVLGVVVAAAMIAFHLVKQGPPACLTSTTELAKSAPYVIAVLGIVFVLRLAGRHAKSYKELSDKSPGASLETRYSG